MNNKYIPLVYSKKMSKNKAYIFLMQHEFIPCELRHSNICTYSSDEEGLNKIKQVVESDNKYLERYEKSIVLQSNIQKPSPTEDWNYYALQRLVDNDILNYNNVIIIYDTTFKDIITIRM